VRDWRWPSTREELAELQLELATANREAPPVRLPERPLVGGCFVAFARGEAGPGRPGDHAWAAAVVWRPPPPGEGPRRPDDRLRGVVQGDEPRQAHDVIAQAVVAGEAPAAYAPGYLALREGPLLARALNALPLRPDVSLVDATGLDHPRRAGVAVHLGAVCDVPTVGATRRPLVATGALPPLRRGATSPVGLGGETVGAWVCTRDGAQPIVAHPAWRTDVGTATELVLATSTGAARTPVPLQEARRVAREARALATP
jgi:deoxyribonuclease V